MPLLWLSSAFLCGIVLGDLLGWPAQTWLVLAALVLLSHLIVRRILPASPLAQTSQRGAFLSPPAPLSHALLMAVACLGAIRLQAEGATITPFHVAWYNDLEKPVIVEGVVAGYPDVRDSYVNLRIASQRIRALDELNFTPVRGELLAKVPAGGDWRYGDYLRLQGWLNTPPELEEFSYRLYLERQGIHSLLYCSPPEDCVLRLGQGKGSPIYSAIYALRERAHTVVKSLFPEPEASLLAGILLGLEGEIPEEVYEAFRNTGTAHIIAISGFNFAIIAGLFGVLFTRWLGRWRGMLAAFVGVAFYAVLAGASAAVVRAAVMGVLALLAVQLGRRGHGLNTLVFVAALMAVFNPYVLWDVGFQLSFMATLGLVLYAGPLDEWFRRSASRYLPENTVGKVAGPVGEYFLFTLAAQLTVLPVLIYHFQQLSLISLVANPLVLPAQPPVMILGGLAVMIGLMSQGVGQWMAYLAWPFPAYTIRIVEWLDGWRMGVINLGEVSLFLVAGFYILLFGLTLGGGKAEAWWSERFPRIFSLKSLAALLVAMSLLGVVLWQSWQSAPDGKLHLTVLDVGEGEALLIETPDGDRLLVNGGASVTRLLDALGRRLPVTNRELETLVVAGVSDEQVEALPRALERTPVREALWAGSAAASYSARALNRELSVTGVPVTQAEPGFSLDLGQGAMLKVLAEGRRGAVLLLEWGGFSALLPLGMDFESMDILLKEHSPGPVTVLLLAEGGFAPVNTREWIERWNPRLALLSVAAGDKLGRPDAETLEALDGYQLLRTDLNGWIEVSTDGERLWVEVERK